MESLPKDRFLKFNENTLEDVRKAFNLDKSGEMEEAVNILEEWVKQQKHFTYKDFNRHYLEYTIIVSKGSLERAKQRLDKACTLKNLMPDLFEEFDVRNYYPEVLEDITQAILPKMTKDNCRIYFMRTCAKQFSSTLVKNFMRVGITFCEYARSNDYAMGYHVIADGSDCNIVDLASKLNINDVRYFATMLIDGYGFPVKGIHILSQSKVIDMIVAVLKQVVSAKVGGRIQVHKHIDSIIDVVGKDTLPAEYGGNEKSLEKLQEEWFDVMGSKEHKEYLRVMNAARTDESLRPRDTFNEQYIGMPGTFRTLTVD